MTTKLDRQKALERSFVRSFLQLAARQADIQDWEQPDFIIHDATGSEGIEVTLLFVDDSEHGSPTKRGEKGRAGFLKELASAYYADGGHPVILRADLPSQPSEELLVEMKAALLATTGLELMKATKLRNPPADLDMWVTRLPPEWKGYARWQCIDDRVGWLRQLDPETVAARISEKATRLAKYLQSVPRVNLLLVADRIDNSGKLYWKSQGATVDSQGFDAVFLLIHPLELWRIA